MCFRQACSCVMSGTTLLDDIAWKQQAGVSMSVVEQTRVTICSIARASRVQCQTAEAQRVAARLLTANPIVPQLAFDEHVNIVCNEGAEQKTSSETA